MFLLFQFFDVRNVLSDFGIVKVATSDGMRADQLPFTVEPAIIVVQVSPVLLANLHAHHGKNLGQGLQFVANSRGNLSIRQAVEAGEVIIDGSLNPAA